MQEAQLRLFFERYASGTNTVEEHQQFVEWLKTASLDEVEVILEQYDSAFPVNFSGGEVDPGLVSQIEATLDQYELGKEQNPKRSRIIWGKFFFKMAAASLIICTAGVIGYFALKKPELNTITKTPILPVKVIGAPGTNKAVLTLADGSTIMLDDANNGQIATQGGTQIVKLANGQLVYKALSSKPDEVVLNTLTTPRGGQFKLNLPDGSKVWLNAVSSIKYPTAFIGTERNVEIAGEAYFEVAHDPAKQFKVSVNGMEVKVLGTHFNINAYNDEETFKTTLLEGSVSLKKSDVAVTIKPGQQAQVGNENGIRVVNNVDVDQAVAWKNGYFSFYRADLQTVIRQISRWYDVEIQYSGHIPEGQFGGKIDRNSNVSEVLKILEESGVHFRIEEKRIIVGQ